MNKNISTILFSVSFLFPLFSLSQSIDPALCPDKLQGFDNIQVQQSLSQDGLRCYWTAHPRDAFETMIYRDYMVASDGFMMVFNSYGDFEGSGSSGAREFFFLNSDFKGFQWEVQEGFLILQGFAGRTLKFNMKTAQLDSVSDAEVKVASQVSPKNKGGVEIILKDALLVDAGFKLGASPSYSRTGLSTVFNRQSQSCRLKNSQAFKYLNDSVYLKSEAELQALIRRTCGNFKLD